MLNINTDIPNTILRIKTRIQTFRPNLQAEADNVGNMWDNDGHFTLHQLIKHLHGLTGLVLYTNSKFEQFNRSNLSININTFNWKWTDLNLFQKCFEHNSSYLVCLDQVFQSNNQTWNNRAHLVLLQAKRQKSKEKVFFTCQKTRQFIH